MNRSRVVRILLAMVALSAVIAGAGGGRAATLALSRAVGDAGRSVAEMNPQPRLPAISNDLDYERAK